MTDREAEIVKLGVEHYLGGTPAFDVGNPEYFEQLVTHVRRELPDAAEDDLGAATAMCVLGPGAAGIPPSEMREELLENILRHEVPDEMRWERVVEVTIAYGCGKW